MERTFNMPEHWPFDSSSKDMANMVSRIRRQFLAVVLSTVESHFCPSNPFPVVCGSQYFDQVVQLIQTYYAKRMTTMMRTLKISHLQTESAIAYSMAFVFLGVVLILVTRYTSSCSGACLWGECGRFFSFGVVL